MYIVIIGIAVFIMAFAGVYLYHFLHRIVTFWYHGQIKRWMKVLIVICSVILSIGCMNPFGTMALVMYHILGIAVVLEIINGAFYLVKKMGHRKFITWEKIYRCGLVPVLITAIILSYGHIHMLDVQPKTYEVSTEKHLSNSEGYKVAFISDLHFGATMNEIKLKKYCNDISSQNVDFVILGGDIVDERTTKEQMEQAFKNLGEITSKYGTFYVYGNHDNASYSRASNFTINDLNQTLLDSGIHCMVDKTYKINDDLLLVGRNDRGFSRNSGRASTEELLSKQDMNRFILLVDHQPVELEQNANAGVDLQLSGHTHGGQIWPVGLISDILGFGEVNYGEKQIDNYKIIVSSGIAGWRYAVRTGHNSEYLIVKIK